MAKPPPFAPIKADAPAMVASLPEGRVVIRRDIGAHPGVTPHHVVGMPKTLDAREGAALPAGRVVASDPAARGAVRLPRRVQPAGAPATLG